MIVFIAMVCFPIVVCFLMDFIEDHSRMDFDDYLFPILFISVCLGMFLGFQLESRIYQSAAKTQKVEVIAEMTAISDSTSGRRSFIRTYGTEDSYVFRYVVQGRFGKQVKEIKNSSTTYIVEDDNKTPSIVKYYNKLDNKFLSFLIFESIFDKEKRTEVVVPSGTIEEGYTVDLN
mgnify:CR=1 FL=1